MKVIERIGSCLSELRVSQFLVVTIMFAIQIMIGLPALGDLAPRSLAQLQQAELIVVGTILQVEIKSESAEFERGFGNYDWGIYLTLSVDVVEKGKLSDSEIVFRCFRIQSRRSAVESITIIGHDPIPETGSQVRVYLKRRIGGWAAVVPNGITSPGANDNESLRSTSQFNEATTVSHLRTDAFTFLLPLELWGVIACLVSVVAALVLVRKRIR